MDRNTFFQVCIVTGRLSLSARRAWIEIVSSLDDILAGVVALRKESVDRNINCNSNFTQKKHVALRKESVDRNPVSAPSGAPTTQSLSARRAWIEIPSPKIL